MSRWPLHLFLFLGTCVTTFSCYRTFYGGTVVESALFSGTALLILGAHEMGHYLMARAHGVDSSLPYFIPVPLGFGTLGAVIRIRGRIPNRNALVDIGAAGPLAGLLIALPMLIAGTLMAHTVDVPLPDLTFPGDMSLISAVRGAMRWATTGAPPENMNVLRFGDNVLTLIAQRTVFGAHETNAPPVFVAAWFGMLVTMLNLMPIGQLDGGHLTHAWFGPRAIRLGKVLAIAMALLAIFYSVGWVVWLAITTRVIGFKHPEVAAPEEPLSRGRKWVCAICFIFFVLTLMPVPVSAS